MGLFYNAQISIFFCHIRDFQRNANLQKSCDHWSCLKTLSQSLKCSIRKRQKDSYKCLTETKSNFCIPEVKVDKLRILYFPVLAFIILCPDCITHIRSNSCSSCICKSARKSIAARVAEIDFWIPAHQGEKYESERACCAQQEEDERNADRFLIREVR